MTNTKTYDGTTSASAMPTITSGSLATGDTANFTETYSTRNVGTGLTLTPSGRSTTATAVTTTRTRSMPIHTGVIDAEALTITAVTNTKTYDGTTSAAAMPTITSGSLATGDTANFIETYSSPNVGTGLTLTPSGTVNDGNGGNNYTYTFDADVDRRDHGRGTDDHGGDQHQDLRRHDERGGDADDHVGQLWQAVTRPTSSRPTTPRTWARA